MKLYPTIRRFTISPQLAVFDVHVLHVTPQLPSSSLDSALGIRLQFHRGPFWREGIRDAPLGNFVPGLVISRSQKLLPFRPIVNLSASCSCCTVTGLQVLPAGVVGVVDEDRLAACNDMVGVEVVDREVVDALGGGPLGDRGYLDVGASGGPEPHAGRQALGR